ncbi:hypothetical protein EDB80DRAFT_414451 [Ilyonectria destructans]|nr:hypothetical protein EDB80DRAFT_414451 [Ilyonectria destructans]
MDPLSIAASAAGLASGCAGIIGTLYTWIDDTIDVDENVSGLVEEVTALSRVLESVSNASIKARKVVVAEIDPDGNLWISVRDTLGDISSTLDKLKLLLADVQKSSTSVFSRGFLRKPTKQIRFSLRLKDINNFKERIKSYNTAMASALQMINVCLLIQNNSSQEYVVQVLSSLKSQVRRVEFALQAGNPLGAGPVEVREENDRISRNMRKLVRVAEDFHSSASTIVMDGPRSTVYGGSIMGDPLTDEQVSGIHNWIPPPIEEEPVTGDHPQSDGTSTTAVEVGRLSDSDDDIDKELARRLEELAMTNQKAGEYQKAENFYRRAIDSGETSHRSSQDLAMMKTNLAYVCVRQEKWSEAKEIVDPLAFEKKVHDVLVYHSIHALAMVSAKNSDLDAAYRYGMRALWGKRKVMGKSHPSCWDTSALLSRICFARGDVVDAEVHKSFIPSSSFQEGHQRSSIYSSSRELTDLDALAYLDRAVLTEQAVSAPVDASDAGSSITTGTPDPGYMQRLGPWNRLVPPTSAAAMMRRLAAPQLRPTEAGSGQTLPAQQTPPAMAPVPPRPPPPSNLLTRILGKQQATQNLAQNPPQQLPQYSGLAGRINGDQQPTQNSQQNLPEHSIFPGRVMHEQQHLQNSPLYPPLSQNWAQQTSLQNTPQYLPATSPAQHLAQTTPQYPPATNLALTQSENIPQYVSPRQSWVKNPPPQQQPEYLSYTNYTAPPQQSPVPSPRFQNISETPSKARLVIGVRFGTVHSAVAFAFVNGMDAREDVITEWPGAGTKTEPTVPSVLYYDQYEKVVGWGHDIADALAPTGYPKSGIQKVEWFKLYLMLGGNQYVNSKDFPPLPIGKDARDISADYLFHLRQAIRQALQKELGDVFNREERNIHWSFTISAVCNESGKTALRTAIERAGYLRDERDPRLSFVTQSEAAILFSSRTGLINVRKHDAILVLDCGKGTVDMMAHEVENTDPLRVSDLTASSGDSCGSTALNRNFSDLLRKKLRKMRLPEGSKTVGRVYAKAIMDFDKRIKDDFRNNGQKWAVDVGIESVWPEADIDEGYMVFTNDEIQKCFEPVIGRILELMKNQVLAVQSQYKTLGAVILIGEFGMSEYLFQQVKMHVPPTFQVDVLRPMDAKSAVVKGVIIAGMYNLTCGK